MREITDEFVKKIQGVLARTNLPNTILNLFDNALKERSKPLVKHLLATYSKHWMNAKEIIQAIEGNQVNQVLKTAQSALMLEELYYEFLGMIGEK